MAKVLIVEDDIDLRETYCDLLESAGHEVTTIGSTTEALDYLIRSRKVPNVVVLDMLLPGGSGILVLGSIRRLARLSRTKVIIASGHLDLAKQAINQWGADSFLSKPIPLETLKATIQHLSHDPLA